MALSSNERNAFIKATKIRGWESVRRMEYGRYLVKSASSEQTYVVTGTDRMGRDHTCSFQAALSGRYCWHRAAVVLARQRYEWTKARAAQVPAQPAQAAAVHPAILEAAKTSSSPRRVALV
ncbi:MAG TPA: SWIM zinc finger family protein [Chloroflexota bacterium]|nr:SWIM zinc finger family protein [Chloroflexota bacterium]